MSDPENFIARWSRRKRAAAENAEEQRVAAPGPAAQDVPVAEHADKQAEGAPAAGGGPPSREPTVDLSKLPPIESIGAESDLRAFLAPGVPPELTRAALRRAWSADPRIRDFIGLSENSWDFNDPGAIAGFGPLEMTDELRRQIARMVGASLEDAAEEPAPSGAREGQASHETKETEETRSAVSGQQGQNDCGTPQDQPKVLSGELHDPGAVLQSDKNHTAAQYDPKKPDALQPIVKRPHGRALPK